MDEHGVHYNQTEEYDPFTADVITYVPAHERDGLILHELTKIENEGLGLVVWKLTDENFCHLEDLNPRELPTRFVLEVATMEARNITLVDSMLTIEYVHSMDDGEWEGDREDLTADMQKLCEGIPIRKDISRVISHAEFEALVNGGGTGRNKRQNGQSTRRAHCCGHGVSPRMMAKRSADNFTQPHSGIEYIHTILASDIIMD